MGAVLSLVSRNMKLYFRDKSAVFFSLLSVLVIILVFILFLGKVHTDSIIDTYGNTAGISWLINSWVMAGIIVVNSITVTLAVFGTMVKDQEEKRLAGFFVAPISRAKLVLGYLLSAWIIGVIMTILTFILAQIYIVADGGQILSVMSMIKAFGLTCLNVFSGSAMVFFIAGFIKSTNAFSALSAVLGILIGFLTGIYMPIGNLPEMVQPITQMIPATHGAVLMRQVFIEDATALVFADLSERTVTGFNDMMGCTMIIGETTMPNTFMIAVLAFSGILFLGLSVLTMNRKRK
jgi:multidrug/hemolysin transport system permease protein